MPKSSKNSQADIKQLLEKQKKAFFNEVRDRIGDKDRPDQKLLLQLNEHERSYYQKIESAFKRLVDGKLGICLSCKKEIEFRRLKARPIAALCIECQCREEEKERIPALDDLTGEGFLSGSFLGRGTRS